MILHAVAGKDVRDGTVHLIVNQGNALAVFVLDETGSGARACRECKPKRRRQHAKHIEQSEQLTCLQSLGLGQACQQTRTFLRRNESFVAM